MLELLFLLLPVAVCYGWYMGKRSESDNRDNHYSHLSEKYVTGINFLLSDQLDKASDQFVSLLELQQDSFDTHIALGNLFRERGELDRATHCHQSALAQPNLSALERSRALLALARDFIGAGLLERAEMILVKLNSPHDHEEACTQLLELYTQIQEWDKAIDVATQLYRYKPQDMQPLIAHFYCERAESVLKNPTYENRMLVKKYIQQAIETDENNIRAHLMQAQIDISNANYTAALQSLYRALAIDIHHFPTALPLLLQCYQALNAHEKQVKDMKRFVEQGAGYMAASVLIDSLYKEQNIELAKTILFRELHRYPTLGGIYHLIKLNLQESHNAEVRVMLQVLMDLIAQKVQAQPSHQCQRCGFEMQQLFWRCPTCHHWGHVKPVRESIPE